MTQTTFTDNVLVEGSRDIPQLAVQGAPTQSQPLQTWLDSTGTTQAAVTAEGRLELGNNQGPSAPHEAYLQINQDLSLPTTSPTSGWFTLGRLSGTVTSPQTWASHELQLVGNGAVSGTQTTLRATLTHGNTGSATNAELRAAEYQTVVSGASAQQATAIRAAVVNGAGASLTKAVGLELALTNAGSLTEAALLALAPPVNSGTIGTLYGLYLPDLTQGTTNYALVTGAGTVKLGDALETKVFSVSPSSASTGYVKLYLKVDAGVPSLYGKDSSGVEHALSTGAASAPLTLTGTSNTLQLLVRGYSTQTADLQQWQKSDGTVIASLAANGRFWLTGQTDDVRFVVKGSPTQTNDLLQLQRHDGMVIYSIASSGGTSILGQGDTLQLLVKGSTSQTANLQEWQQYDGEVVASLDSAGKLITTGFQMTTGAVDGAFLRSDGFGEASWAGLTSSDLTAALSTPPPIGSTTPSTGTFNNLLVTGNADQVQLVVKAHTTQTWDLQQWLRSDGEPIATLTANGGFFLAGQSDAIRVVVRGSTVQTTDLLQLQRSDGSTVYAVSGTGATSILGQSDNVQLLVRGHSTQTYDLQQWQNASGASIASLSSGGSLWVIGQSDGVRLLVKGSPSQTSDLFQLQNHTGNVVYSVAASGGTSVLGKSDAIQLLVQGSSAQSANLQEWQQSGGTVVASLSNAGLFTTTGFKLTTGAGDGYFLKSDNTGLAAWSVITGSDLGSAFASPPPIGNTTPSTGAFTSLSAAGTNDVLTLLVKGNATQSANLQEWQQSSGAVVAFLSNAGLLMTTTFRMTTGAMNGRFLQSDASGNGTWQPAVTSVGLTMPSIFSVAGSPVTTTGTLAVSLVTQSANRVFAGPASGGAAVPTFRALVAADLSTALATPPTIGGTTPAAGTFTTLTATTSLNGTVTDSGTNTIVNMSTLTHNSSGTPTVGFGTGVLFCAESSTTNGQSQGRIRTEWATATHASRKARMFLGVFDTAERVALTLEASGSAPMIGFLGATPAIRQTGGAKTAGATYGTNEQSMLQIAYNALRTFGLLT